MTVEAQTRPYSLASGVDAEAQPPAASDVANAQTQPASAAPTGDERRQAPPAALADPAEAEILSATRELIAEAAARPDRFRDADEAAAKLRRTAQLGTADAADLLSWATTEPALAQVRCQNGGDLLTVATEALVGMGHPHAMLVDPNALEHARGRGGTRESSIPAVLGWSLQLSGSVVGTVLLIAAAIEFWGSSRAGLLAPGFFLGTMLAAVLVSSKSKARREVGLFLEVLAGLVLLVNGLLLPSSEEVLLTWASEIALAAGIALLAASHPPRPNDPEKP